MRPPSEPAAVPGRGRARRLAASILGLLLLIAAIYAVSARTDALARSFESARTADPLLILAIIVLPVANIAVISASFWSLTRRFGRVAPAEMFALILSSWLLNHLPLRPGLVGRIGYHRIVNGIPVASALRVVVEQFLLGLVALALMVVAIAALAPLGAWIAIGLLLAVGSLLAGWGALAMRRLPPSASSQVGPCYTAAFGFRLLDMTIWIIRYLCLFAVVGQPLTLRHAAGITAASQAAMLSPVPLGLREWTVGFVHAVLAPEGGAAAEISVQAMAPGVSADLANRAVELLVSVPLGLIATLWLARRIRSLRRPDQGTHLPPVSSV